MHPSYLFSLSSLYKSRNHPPVHRVSQNAYLKKMFFHAFMCMCNVCLWCLATIIIKPEITVQPVFTVFYSTCDVFFFAT